ncbi:hypothetical protein P7K49_021303 [Saguinus oedipus]|uniref:Uncharacterized protein n=1 Tax=Saguinus oedipus TaxID=9490 RepID=A0ABQ9UT30_SAGOE|nr:hypothetical protein P7K49_021303 [Saguinus oedipus]
MWLTSATPPWSSFSRCDQQGEPPVDTLEAPPAGLTRRTVPTWGSPRAEPRARLSNDLPYHFRFVGRPGDYVYIFRSFRMEEVTEMVFVSGGPFCFAYRLSALCTWEKQPQRVAAASCGTCLLRGGGAELVDGEWCMGLGSGPGKKEAPCRPAPPRPCLLPGNALPDPSPSPRPSSL